MRLAVVDLECTELNSDKGFLLCAGIKELDKKGKIISLDKTGFGRGRYDIDSKLAKAIRDEMEEYDGWITWNGLMFDFPFLDDRLMFNGQRGLEKRFARGLDMMYHASYGKSRMKSRRLDWVAKALKCPHKKTDLDLGLWKEAETEAIQHFKQGKANFKYIIDHCLADLDVTEWVYQKLRRRIQTISKR